MFELIYFAPPLSVNDVLMTVGIDVGAGLLVALIFGAVLLWALRRLQLRQHAYEDAPKTHQVKTGTPTMGGIVFLCAAALMFVNWGDPLVTAFAVLIFGCGAIGLADDLLSIVRGKNLGLRGRTKFLATALVAIIFLRLADASYMPYPRDVLFHAGSFSLIGPHWLWLVLGVIAVTGTIHAVNLTDGLDGLATGTILLPYSVLAVIGFQTNVPSVVDPLLLTIGACLGFLFYNRHPAKMFMGDTGSLTLGAVLSGAAILTGEMLLLVLIGGVFVAEALSVIIQVAYFKRTKKRIFRMSPLHHHFELGGWPETKVTTRFWFASAVLSLLGLVIVR